MNENNRSTKTLKAEELEFKLKLYVQTNRQMEGISYVEQLDLSFLPEIMMEQA